MRMGLLGTIGFGLPAHGIECLLDRNGEVLVEYDHHQVLCPIQAISLFRAVAAYPAKRLDFEFVHVANSGQEKSEWQVTLRKALKISRVGYEQGGIDYLLDTV